MVATMLMAALAAAEAPPLRGGVRQHSVALLPDDQASRKVFTDWGFSEALVVGDSVYLSGVVAGPAPGESDMEAAYVRAFDRIAATLAKAGASWDDVVDITSFHTDLPAQLPVMIAVKSRYVKPPFPAWTAVGVTRLVPNSGITEIKVLARARPLRVSPGASLRP